MKTTFFLGCFTVLATLSTGALAGHAATDLTGLEEGSRALVAKERARQMMFKSEGESLQNEDRNAKGGSRPSSNSPSGLDSNRPIVKSGGVSGGCNIDIGNSDSGGMGMSKPKPVIITGPVIQNCK